MTVEAGEEQASIVATCVACREPIHAEATQCRTCGSTQGWLRHFSFSQSVLSLLVALVSVTGISAPVIIQAARGQYSAISVRFAASSGDRVTFAVVNSGTRKGMLKPISIQSLDHDKLYPLTTTELISPIVIEPGDMKSLTLVYPGFNDLMKRDKVSHLRVHYSSMPFSGGTEKDTFDLTL